MEKDMAKNKLNLLKDPVTNRLWLFETPSDFSVETYNGIVDFTRMEELEAELVCLAHWQDLIALVVRNDKGYMALLSMYKQISMGGHGALVSYGNGFVYKSISAYSKSFNGDLHVFLLVEDITGKWGVLELMRNNEDSCITLAPHVLVRTLVSVSNDFDTVCNNLCTYAGVSDISEMSDPDGNGSYIGDLTKAS